MRGRWLALGALVFMTTTASAQPKKDPPPTVECTLYEVSLTSGKEAKTDEGLKPLAKKLANPTFASWNTRTLLSTTTKKLEALKAEPFPLKLGKASVMFEQIIGKSKVRLALQTDDSAGKRVLDTKITIEGADFFVTVRPEGKTQQHLLALTCK